LQQLLEQPPPEQQLEQLSPQQAAQLWAHWLQSQPQQPSDCDLLPANVGTNITTARRSLVNMTIPQSKKVYGNCRHTACANTLQRLQTPRRNTSDSFKNCYKLKAHRSPSNVRLGGNSRGAADGQWGWLSVRGGIDE